MEERETEREWWVGQGGGKEREGGIVVKPVTEKHFVKSETRITASVLKQDPNTQKVPKSAIY